MNDDTKNELVSMSSNLGEVALDSVIKDGIFKDIPVIGTAISIAKAGRSISDKMLMTRIIHFINELDLKSIDEVEKLKRKHFKEKDYPKIGSKILLALEKADDSEKIKWLAKCFTLFLDKEIDRTKFMRLTSIINNAYTDDVKKIHIFLTYPKITSQNNKGIETYVLDHLYSIGVLQEHGFDGGDSSGINSGTVYGLNSFGELILNRILG